MTKLYCADWIIPVAAPPIENGAIAVTGDTINAVGPRAELIDQFPDCAIEEFAAAAIIPGLVNTHTHLELTAMRGFLEKEELDFFAWLKKLTIARLEKLTADDLNVSALWGACEAARAGVTCVADASDSALESMNALRSAGLRGVVFQESFGPDSRLALENFSKLQDKVERLRAQETHLVKCGVSPHAPYTVSAPQLKMIAQYAIDEDLPVMMHAAETLLEVVLLRDGSGTFAEGLKTRFIEWTAPNQSPIQYLQQSDILRTRPLLAHCIHIDENDLEILSTTKTRIAHCPKSNAKLGHGIAPFMKFLEHGITVGLGSDSVASNNVCDMFEEARYALLLARAMDATCGLTADEMFRTITLGGADALGWKDSIGALSPGLAADFAVVSLNGSHQIPSYDPVTTLIFSSGASDVVLTVVAGKEIYRDGIVVTVDEERLRARMHEIACKLSH